MIKKIISTALCVVTLASAALPAGAVGTIDKTSDVSEGSVIKCGKYLVLLANNYKKDRTSIYRTALNGKKSKLVARTKIFNDAQLYSYKGKVYYRKDEKIYKYTPKSNKKSVAVKLDPKNKYKLRDKKGFFINIKGICSEGFVVDYRKEGLCLVDFEGNKKVISPYDKKGSVYIGSADGAVFYYKPEKKKDKRYVAGVYRYEAGAENAERVSQFTTVRKASAMPDSAYAYITDKKIVFTAGVTGGDGFEGCVYSMNTDGSQLKKLKENTGGNITPGKNCAYLGLATKKGDYILYKISKKGKLSAKLKYTNGNYPIISYTTEKDSALAINVSRFNYGYDVFALGKIAKAKGKKLFDADSQIKNAYTGNVLVSPTISGSAGDIALVTYGIYCYASDNSLEYVYKCESYLVNARSGNKVLIDR